MKDLTYPAWIKLKGALFLLLGVAAAVLLWLEQPTVKVALLLALALSVGRQLFSNELSGTTFGPASRAFYETLLAYLQRGQEVVLWLGLVLVVAGWFAGAMDWVGKDTGHSYATVSRETQCAAEGHDHCLFSVTPMAG